MQFAKLGDSPMFRKQHDANSAALGKYFQSLRPFEELLILGTVKPSPTRMDSGLDILFWDRDRSKEGIVTTKIFKDRIFMKGTQTGNGSTLGKKNIIVNRMCSCREMEIKYLARILAKNLQTIAMIRTVLPALAQVVINS
ncbi:hypothetical protein K1719_012369 [Acacia pycnantha]|nr:hypothetical protein K1719_012369 [Acacia pycnantha]